MTASTLTTVWISYYGVGDGQFVGVNRTLEGAKACCERDAERPLVWEVQDNGPRDWWRAGQWFVQEEEVGP